VVSWLTRAPWTTGHYGQRRPAAQESFLGQYDAFYTCDIVFYMQERNALHILKECSPLQARQVSEERLEGLRVRLLPLPSGRLRVPIGWLPARRAL